MVDLQQPRLALVIQHDINPKDLKAQWILYVVRLWGLVHMLYLMNTWHQCFDTDAFYFVPNLGRAGVWLGLAFSLGVLVLLIYPVEDACQTPFVANIVMGSIFILLKIALLLIYRVICQMHTQWIQIGANRTSVVFCSEPCQAFLIDETPERTDPRHKHIDPQIKLEPFYQQRLVQVLLRHIVLALHEPIVVPRQEYTITLALLLRLDYKSFRPFFIELLFENFGVLWQDPGLRKEVEVVWKELLQSIQVFGQKLLVR